MKAIAAATCLALLSPLSVTAADFAPPAGCKGVLTVQSRECTLLNLYICEGDDSIWEATFSADGFDVLAQYSPDYIWRDIAYLWDQSRETFLEPAEDAPSLAELAKTGVDTFRYTVHRTAPGEDRLLTIVGADMLSGETVVIDGVTLARVDTELQILDDEGTVEYASRGTQYLDVERGLFFWGKDAVLDADGAETVYDNSPVDFIEPGEPGFGAAVPLYDCNEQKIAFEVTP
ncbi:hypothetical protein [Maritimibacter sp. DP1N21-5]|uniref:hypothetical protein n=1 Tax=Maritimibacter sp. DP1N21-5 TaxID=2836867 RepID=UPI001C476E1B|nr:hypothetical protein [Maritimibacter sp. DP1N21-5]MBV7410880.1 hypothetical protein [Maritimibacter sp. DP1N21-5]